MKARIRSSDGSSRVSGQRDSSASSTSAKVSASRASSVIGRSLVIETVGPLRRTADYRDSNTVNVIRRPDGHPRTVRGAPLRRGGST